MTSSATAREQHADTHSESIHVDTMETSKHKPASASVSPTHDTLPPISTSTYPCLPAPTHKNHLRTTHARTSQYFRFKSRAEKPSCSAEVEAVARWIESKKDFEPPKSICRTKARVREEPADREEPLRGSDSGSAPTADEPAGRQLLSTKIHQGERSKAKLAGVNQHEAGGDNCEIIDEDDDPENDPDFHDLVDSSTEGDVESRDEPGDDDEECENSDFHRMVQNNVAAIQNPSVDPRNEHEPIVKSILAEFDPEVLGNIIHAQFDTRPRTETSPTDRERRTRLTTTDCDMMGSDLTYGIIGDSQVNLFEEKRDLEAEVLNMEDQ